MEYKSVHAPDQTMSGHDDVGADLAYGSERLMEDVDMLGLDPLPSTAPLEMTRGQTFFQDD